MPAAPARRRIPVNAIGATTVADPTTERAMGELRDQVERMRTGARAFDLVTFDLVAGLNRVPHKLGRRCTAALVVPSVAAADFAYSAADQSANNISDRVVHVTVAGTAQPGAVLLVF